MHRKLNKREPRLKTIVRKSNVPATKQPAQACHPQGPNQEKETSSDLQQVNKSAISYKTDNNNCLEKALGNDPSTSPNHMQPHKHHHPDTENRTGADSQQEIENVSEARSAHEDPLEDAIGDCHSIRHNQEQLRQENEWDQEMG